MVITSVLDLCMGHISSCRTIAILLGNKQWSWKQLILRCGSQLGTRKHQYFICTSGAGRIRIIIYQLTWAQNIIPFFFLWLWCILFTFHLLYPFNQLAKRPCQCNGIFLLCIPSVLMTCQFFRTYSRQYLHIDDMTLIFIICCFPVYILQTVISTGFSAISGSRE